MDLREAETQIKEIPGNEHVLEKLYKLLDAGEAIALVGAGASAGLWPLWDEVLNGFVDYSLKLGKITETEVNFLKEDALRNPLKVAQQIRKRMEERDYFEYLQETFQDKISPQTDGAFTLTHKALLQLPIHNYMTLNYDAGLTNARAALYPQATTSYFFWDQEEARRIRERGYKRLVLHAHGRHDRSDSIIFTLNDYREAYDNHAFERLLNEIFNSEKLIFVGFGMTDPYIEQLFDNISKDSSTTPFQHIAFVGLNDSEMKVAHLYRERVEMVYGARVLFYPTENHHNTLTDWLQMIAGKYSTSKSIQTAEEIKQSPDNPQIKAVFKAIKNKYVHQPTDDKNYKGRIHDFAKLNRLSNDPDTRIISITGIGGQGKTSMVGRWLKKERDENLAQIPVFYWSFYEDLDVAKFLEQFVGFCRPIIHDFGKEEPGADSISIILDIFKNGRVLLVLDGLEMLQVDSSRSNHGSINDSLLNSFLQVWLRSRHKWLMILTSRFHFPQLGRYSGISFHNIDLVRLSQDDGVSLLEKLNIFGDQNLLKTYVDNLYGHPLALRVLAGTVKKSCYGDLAQFKGEEILTEGDGLSEKLKRLLNYYEQQLKNGQKELMGILSFFKRPVETDHFVAFLGKAKSMENTPLAMANAFTIEQQLNLLIDDFLIEKTDEGITTHPVIRDYFRSGHKITGTHSEVAGFLKAKPGNDRPENIEEVRDLLEAVQLFCDEGKYKVADDLFKERLVEGGYGFNVFKNLPAITEGLECELAFVGDEGRQQRAKEALGEERVASHFSGMSLYSNYLGNLAQAIEWRYKGLEIGRLQQNKSIQAVSLHNISSIETAMGNITKARETVSDAIKLSYESENLSDLRTEFGFKAFYEFLLGNSEQAFQDFEIALCYEQVRNVDEDHLCSLIGNQQAEFLFRIESWKPFEAVNLWNIRICREYCWYNQLAICHLLEGCYYIFLKKFSQAEKVLEQVERILRPSGILENICRLDGAWALLEITAKGNYQKGLQHVNDSLITCADKGFCLRQTEHFVLRGHLFLLQFQKENQEDLDLVEKACDDGNRALKIAEDTGYIWAKADALELVSLCHQTRAKLSDANKEDEKDSALRYAKEAESIKKRLLLSEEQMKELKVKTRKKFGKQTKKWHASRSLDILNK
jgi:tetratricopeptide (TPR) repeat protein